MPDVVDLYNDQPTVRSGLGDLFNQIYVGHEWPEVPHEFLTQDPSTGASARFDPDNERPGRLSYGYAPMPETASSDQENGINNDDANGRSDFDDDSYVEDEKLEPPQTFRGKIKPEDIGRIIGGQEAVAHSWPWMAYLNFRNRYHCGGSLISDQFTIS